MWSVATEQSRFNNLQVVAEQVANNLSRRCYVRKHDRRRSGLLVSSGECPVIYALPWPQALTVGSYLRYSVQTTKALGRRERAVP